MYPVMVNGIRIIYSSGLNKGFGSKSRVVSLSLSLYIYIYIYIYIMASVFANGPEDQGSVSGRVISRTQKWYLMPPCLILRIIKYGSSVSRVIQRKK